MSMAASRARVADERATAVPRARTIELAAVAVPVLLGAIVRAGPALGSGFPVGDGGLFYVMAREIDRAGMTLPMTTAYNGAGIPFAYPPLGLWLIALLGRIVPVSLIDLFHWWPVAWSILTIPAFYLVARRLSRSWVEAVVATTAFALIPRSFESLILGGGVTRAPGYVFALLALHQLLVALDTGRRRHVAAAAVLAGLATMTHPNAALVTVLSAILIGLLRAPGWRSIRITAGVLVGAAIVSAPWWGTAVLRFGPGPLVSAMGAGSAAGPAAGLVRLVMFDFTEEPFLPWIAALGALGLAWSLARREFLLPGWLVGILLLDATAGATDASIPLAMLASVALLRVVIPAVRNGDGPAAGVLVPLRDGRVRMMLAALATFAVIGALFRPVQAESPDRTLAPDVRDAMAWVGANTAPDATFAIVSGQPWYVDVVGEWFPVLADRTSVATIQGHEWLGSADWWHQQDLDASLEACSTGGVSCLTAWIAKYGVHPAYVFLPKGRVAGPMSPTDCCGGLRAALSTSPAYRVEYDGAGASIFRAVSP